jgi:hypothetical protein
MSFCRCSQRRAARPTGRVRLPPCVVGARFGAWAFGCAAPHGARRRLVRHRLGRRRRNWCMGFWPRSGTGVPRCLSRSNPCGGRCELVHGPRTFLVKRKTAFGWSLTLLKMPARLMEDAGAMSRAMRWGGGACIEDMVERGRMNPPQPDRLEAGVGHRECRNVDVRWIGGRWEPGNVLLAGNKGSF